ncbi:hypothetical protein LCGC14_0859560 [marine sediment metagenome]|uniref:Right handed beta helix domain-containing protein n=1 Tax=marine sediment metagenome TaxID=412755 RepID=A0A0F9RSH1_9ZZZZ
MPWTIPDHEKSAIDALNLGVISGDLSVLADMPEPFQSNQHQARVSALSVLYELGGPDATIQVPWSKTMYDWSEPPVDPPSGLFIPKLNGPVLSHDGNPTVQNGNVTLDSGVHTFANYLVRGEINIKGTATLHLTDSEVDGQGGAVCIRTSGGGKVFLERCEVWNAEDGLKNNVDSIQTTVHKLFRSPGAHMDCHQLEGTADVSHSFSYFDAKNGTDLGNAAFQMNSVFAPGSAQRMIAEDCFINGGNYTVRVDDGAAGGFAHAEFHRTLWGGDARYGVKAGPVAVWDVTTVGG